MKDPQLDFEMAVPSMGCKSGWITNVKEEVDPDIPSVEEESIEWDETSSRISMTTKVPTNLCKWLTGEWTCHKDAPGFNPDRSVASLVCSEQSLIDIERDVGDVEKSDNKCLRRVQVPRQRLGPIIHHLARIYTKSSIQLSGFFLYPDGGYMGWHTNSDAPCTRVYITHVAEGGKSFFRYRDNGECVTSWDRPGWNLRQFEVTKDNPLWHCVYAELPRLSIGFRINRNLL